MDICLSVYKINQLGRRVLTGLLCLQTLISFGQEGSELPDWTFSAQVLANYSQIPSYRDIYTPGTHAGFGLNVQYRLKPRLDFRGSLEVNAMAYSRNAVDTNELFIQKTREYYLDLPLGLYFYPSRTERTWGFMLGVTPSFLLGKNLSKKENNPSYAGVPRDPSATGRFDLGIHAGAAIKLNPRWAMSARYTYSVTNQQLEAYNAGRFSRVTIGVSYQFTRPDLTESPKEKAKKADIQHFDKKNMLVMVRLKTETKRIRYLEEGGYVQDAAELKEAVALENQGTMEAFRKGFTFCDVLYFYDTSSNAIAEERYEGYLFNDEGVYTDSLINDSCDLLIAEFGSPYSEAFGTSSGFGLVVYDLHFNQMKEPFPYFVSNFYGLVSRMEVVQRFDKRLREYQKMR